MWVFFSEQACTSENYVRYISFGNFGVHAANVVFLPLQVYFMSFFIGLGLGHLRSAEIFFIVYMWYQTHNWRHKKTLSMAALDRENSHQSTQKILIAKIWPNVRDTNIHVCCMQA